MARPSRLERLPPRTGRPSVRRTTSITSSTYCVGLAALGGRPDAALDVVLEDQDRERVDRGAQGGRLLEDVDAVLLALDHPGDPADLALHPRQAADEAGLVLGVAVPEVGRVGAARRVGLVARGLRAVATVLGDPDGLTTARMIPPGGIRPQSGAARRDPSAPDRVDWRPMDPRDDFRPFADGVDCAACGRFVPTERIRVLARRDDLAFVEIDCPGCRSESLGIIVTLPATMRRPEPPYGEFGPADDERFRERCRSARRHPTVRELLARGGLTALVGRSEPPAAVRR